ncbi:MAG: response regulator [Anaerolineales bacterium]|nr:response regulator [Chloroflexota bacterium]MBL6983520.1 response regulator [Anaerolineales bacterium]
MNKKVIILIVSPPGDLQIGLQALLTTHLDVDVLVVGEGDSALKVIEKYNPALVILDQDVPGIMVPMIVQNIKTNWPKSRCIVLANDNHQRQVLLDAGAEFVIVKGLPGAKLIAEIKQLLEIRNLQ